ncbi:SDR family NAD(P)-dependent oxidoreductase [Microbacterium sp. A196]|uniref:SDR family NAD(P)-dependent oxidoreductase n=1 Tax=unclassified Microbacterium TaxID=2609290 RepID=UPI003F349B73
MDLKLAGKTALVTDATSAIGTAVAERLIVEGAAVLLVDDVAEAVAALAAKHSGAGGKVASAVSEGAVLPAVVFDWCEGFDVAWLGGLAGMSSVSDVVRLVDLIADHMADRRGGSIVLQSTTAAAVDVPGASAPYSAMAAAVTQIARQVGVRRAEQGIRANSVCAGGILNPMTGSVIDAPAVPLAPAAPASDVADAVVFLMSPLASYTTGQAIVIDGGASII